MKIKKMLTLLMIIGMVFGSVTGCGKAGEDNAAAKEGKIEIKFLHKWPEEERMAYFQDIIDKYEDSNPNVKITMIAYGDDAIKDKLRVMVGGSEMPDIFFSWSSQFAKNFIDEGAALDLTSYYENDQEWKDSFNQGMLKCGVFDGKYYGVPFDYVTKHFVYNKEVFEENNIEIPSTWDQLLAVCEKLKNTGITPIAFGNQSPWVACHYITTLNQKLVSEDTLQSNYSLDNTEFTDEGYQTALSMLSELRTEGYINSDVNSATWEMSQSMVCEGKAAMIYEELCNFEGVYQERMEDNWGYFPFPEIVGGFGDQGWITGAPDLFMVSSKSKVADQAVDFLKFMTNKDNAGELMNAMGFVTCVEGVVTEDNANPKIVAAMNDAADATGVAEWMDVAMDASVVDIYLSNLQSVFDGKNPKDIMKEVMETAVRVKNGK